MEYSMSIAKRAKELQEHGVQFSNDVVNDKVYITHGDLLEKDLRNAIKDINKENPNIVLAEANEYRTKRLSIQELNIEDGVLHVDNIIDFYNNNVLTYSTYDMIEKCKELVNKRGEL